MVQSGSGVSCHVPNIAFAACLRARAAGIVGVSCCVLRVRLTPARGVHVTCCMLCLADQFPSDSPQLLVRSFLTRVAADAKNARQHASDVAIENGRGLIESDAAN